MPRCVGSRGRSRLSPTPAPQRPKLHAGKDSGKESAKDSGKAAGSRPRTAAKRPAARQGQGDRQGSGGRRQRQGEDSPRGAERRGPPRRPRPRPSRPAAARPPRRPSAGDRGRIWVKDGNYVRPDRRGIGAPATASTPRSTASEVQEGMEVVVGEMAAGDQENDANNPFAPKFLKGGSEEVPWNSSGWKTSRRPITWAKSTSRCSTASRCRSRRARWWR